VTDFSNYIPAILCLVVIPSIINLIAFLLGDGLKTWQHNSRADKWQDLKLILMPGVSLLVSVFIIGLLIKKVFD
jgi:hypothetical protein